MLVLLDKEVKENEKGYAKNVNFKGRSNTFLTKFHKYKETS